MKNIKLYRARNYVSDFDRLLSENKEFKNK